MGGMLVSIILSSLAIIKLFFIGRRSPSWCYNILSVALVSIPTVCSCLHPYLLPFFCKDLFRALGSNHRLERANASILCFQGLLSFVMYLVRPDGVVFYTTLVVLMHYLLPEESRKGSIPDIPVVDADTLPL